MSDDIDRLEHNDEDLAVFEGLIAARLDATPSPLRDVQLAQAACGLLSEEELSAIATVLVREEELRSKLVRLRGAVNRFSRESLPSQEPTDADELLVYQCLQQALAESVSVAQSWRTWWSQHSWQDFVAGVDGASNPVGTFLGLVASRLTKAHPSPAFALTRSSLTTVPANGESFAMELSMTESEPFTVSARLMGEGTLDGVALCLELSDSSGDSVRFGCSEVVNGTWSLELPHLAQQLGALPPLSAISLVPADHSRSYSGAVLTYVTGDADWRLVPLVEPAIVERNQLNLAFEPSALRALALQGPRLDIFASLGGVKIPLARKTTVEWQESRWIPLPFAVPDGPLETLAMLEGLLASG